MGTSLFKVYAKWIDGADCGREKAKLEALLAKGASHPGQNSSLEFPQGKKTG